MKTVVPKVVESDKKWYLIDAQDEVLGRLASEIAFVLRGKHKPEFTPHLDMGDHVVVVNAEKIRLTGRKISQKKHKRYTGYPSGLRVQSVDTLMREHPERVLYHAIKGMLPKNRLGRKMIKKLRIYAGSEHPHQAQKVEGFPKTLRRT